MSIEKECSDKTATNPTIIEDSILAGALKTLGLNVIPQKNSTGKVCFSVAGDFDSAIQNVYKNIPVGVSDLVQNIKSCRSMIFSLKG